MCLIFESSLPPPLPPPAVAANAINAEAASASEASASTRRIILSPSPVGSRCGFGSAAVLQLPRERRPVQARGRRLGRVLRRERGRLRMQVEPAACAAFAGLVL